MRGRTGARGRSIIVTLALTLCLCFPPLHSEVTVIKDGDRLVGVLEMTVQSILPDYWSPIRPHADPALLLNPDGNRYLDGPPSIQIHPVTGLPEAVWSFREGDHRHIAWSRFDGQFWTEPQQLTSGIKAMEPRLWIDDNGHRRVAYWEDAPGSSEDRVYYLALPAGEVQWWDPVLLSDPAVSTRRPVIRSFPGIGTFVAAESGFLLSLSVVVFDLPELEPGTPQRESDPWGRLMLRDADTPLNLNVGISSYAVAGGAQAPVITWLELTEFDLSLGAIYYDVESGSWSQPTFEPYSLW